MNPSYSTGHSAGTVTAALREFASGVPGAEARFWRIVYPELAVSADRLLRRDALRWHVEAADLVHDAFRRLTAGQFPDCENRRVFYRIAARAMREVLVDRARRIAVRRRTEAHVGLDALDCTSQEPPVPDILDLHDALTELARVAPREANALELRFFSGMSVADVGVVLGVSRVTAAKVLGQATAWLAQRLDR